MSIRKGTPSLSEEEIKILEKGMTNPDIITDYFFRKPGAPRGWRFDENFDPEGAWQKTVHNASQKRIIVIGGFGSGKTRGIAMSACVWALTTRDFSFMNAAPKAWQSELMYRFILDMAYGTPFERLIFKSPQRPYPRIELRFMAGSQLIKSTLEFMSVDKNANAILSWEGDWVNIDEAGLLDDLEETIRNLGSRMRGQVNFRERLGRMSMTSNSWDNPELWMRYDMASSLPDEYLSITVSTRHNHNVTEEQLRMMLRDIPQEEHARFIDGTRPEGRGNYFSKNAVYACESVSFGDLITSMVNKGVPGYDIRTAYGAGVTYFTVPAIRDHFYMVIGDPGTGNAPARNAPCIMVWDVSDFPRFKATMVAFWWGSGNGSITPFVTNLLRFISIYDPIYAGIDSTGPQKNAAELINTYLFSNRLSSETRDEIFGGIDMSSTKISNISGLDFSGPKKAAYLVSGRLIIESGLVLWPGFILGMRSQLTNYDPSKDRAGEPKIPQDLVACFCMSAYAFRVWFNTEPDFPAKAQDFEFTELVNIRFERDERSDFRDLRHRHI